MKPINKRKIKHKTEHFYVIEVYCCYDCDLAHYELRSDVGLDRFVIDKGSDLDELILLCDLLEQLTVRRLDPHRNAIDAP